MLQDGRSSRGRSSRARCGASAYCSARSDLEAQSLIGITRHRLEELGWREGQNIQIEDRWSAGDNNRLQNYAAELAQLNPDVIVCEGTPVVAALQQATRTTPIVFVNANDPIGSGFVASIARPCDGKIACKPVAEAHGLEFTPAEAFID